MSTNYQTVARFGSITNVVLLRPYFFPGTFLAGGGTANISVYAAGAQLHTFS